MGNQSRAGSPTPHLRLDVVRHVRKGVALGNAALVGDFLIAAGKANRLEAEEADLLGIVQSKLDDAPHLLVVDPVDDGGHRHDLHAGLVQIVDGLQLHVEEVAHFAVRVSRVADAVELQVDVAQAGLGRARQSSLHLANSMPFEAACTLL